MMNKKKGIVLFTTILLIMALLATIMLFLNSTRKVKDEITYEFALIQTNTIMYNLVKYFNDIEFDEDIIFYGSKMPFNLQFGESRVKIKIDSAHKYLNINSLSAAMSKKDNIVYDDFINMLYQYNVKDPEFFVDLLLDTLDADNIEKNSGSGSEISLQNPIFRNGKIYNNKHFNIILDYYSNTVGDKAIFKVPFNNIISFNAPSIDINFANEKLLNVIFHDANTFSLNIIKKHTEIYEKLEDLPFDEFYLKEIRKGRFGHSVETTSSLISVVVELSYKEQFKSKIKFLYNIKNKTLQDYTILDILENQ